MSEQIELSIKSDYVEWEDWECVREFIQNAKDASQRESELEITHSDKQLEVKNIGSTLERKSLVLGETTKRQDESKIGQFGEGFKLALACLAEGSDYSVKIRTGNEVWHPSITYSDKYQTEVLTITVEEKEEFKNVVNVIIDNIGATKWGAIKKKFTFLEEKNVAFVDDRSGYGIGELLKGRSAGKIYVKGIYVTNIKDVLQFNTNDSIVEFGYNFYREVETDRDRRLADPNQITNAIANLVDALVIHGKASKDWLYKKLKSGNTLISEILKQNSYLFGRTITNKLYNKFKEKYDEDTYPVPSDRPEAVRKLEHAAIKTKAVSPALAQFLQTKKDYKQAVEEVDKKPNKIYELDDLTEEEREVIREGEKIAGVNIDDLRMFEVVEFNDEDLGGKTKGRFLPPENSDWPWVILSLDEVGIRVARSTLKSVEEFVEVYIHELAHTHGEDGRKEHVRRIQTLFVDATMRLKEQLNECRKGEEGE